ncbi:ATP-binding protein [Roseivirga echinicomitans]
MISRYQLDYAKNRLFKGKALIIYGPRQVGKTTFVELLLESETTKAVLRLNGDDADTRSLLTSPNLSMLQALIGKNKILFIDEAQRIVNIGVLIKIITDRIKDVQVIATGSSSFELANHINEPLTGRKYEMLLLPLAYQELVDYSDFLTESRLTEQRLIYGAYPEIITNPTDASEHLKLLAESYLYKDLFTLDKIKKPQLLQKIARALALQVGSEVSVTEIGRLVAADNKTVEKYINLLEMAFVVFTLPALSRNVRNEIKKGRKIYFYDNGILNAVSGNFMPLQNRKDVGALWENYLVSERLKWQYFQQKGFNNYFWRTTQQQEIDFIEETTEDLNAFEFKWNDKATSRFSTTFLNAYPNAKTMLVTPETRHEFLSQ